MKSSCKTQNIYDLNIDESTIRNAYEGLFENPCRLYYELEKAFLAAREKMPADLIDSIIF